jgi:hypothetical protein
MLLDAIATVILAGLMLIPLVNVIVGGVLGAGLAGPLGGVVGILLAIAITALETWLADWLGLRDLHPEPFEAAEPAADEAITERTIKTGPPVRRRQSHRAPETKPARRAAHSGKLQGGAVPSASR